MSRSRGIVIEGEGNQMEVKTGEEPALAQPQRPAPTRGRCWHRMRTVSESAPCPCDGIRQKLFASKRRHLLRAEGGSNANMQMKRGVLCYFCVAWRMTVWPFEATDIFAEVRSTLPRGFESCIRLNHSILSKESGK